MPLMQKKSKKAFEHNVKAELSAGKPQPQALAIAYSVKRKPKKKMAEGGEISAKSEKRPMPENRYDDSKMVSRNSGNKPPKDDNWLDQPTVKQAQANDNKGKRLPIKRPSMVPTNAFSTRLYDEEGNLQESAKPGPYGAQPPKHDDEEGADRQGPKVRDMADEHSTGRKPYAKGGKIERGDSQSHNINKRTSMEPADHGIQQEERDEERDLQAHASPSEDEGSMDAHSRNEEGPDRHGHDVRDMEEPHNEDQDKIYGFADGGEIGRSPDDSEDQPEHEEEEEHHNSIAAAIMARRERLHAEIDSGAHDMDEAVRMAEGGILSHDSIYSDDSSQADLSRNHDEDANEEDQLSFNALRKENYNDSDLDIDGNIDSAQHGDSEEKDSENKHGMIYSIRRKMSSRRQF